MNRRYQKSRSAPLALLMALLIGACTMIDMNKPPPSDWPELRVEIIRDFTQTQKCAGTAPPFSLAYACAYPDFDQGICWIFQASDGEYAEYALEHEMEHCRGRDHFTDSIMKNLWEKWKAKRHAAVTGKGA